LKIATFNVNGIRARVGAVCRWLELEEPDVLCMQETKVIDEDFPTGELARLGYAVTLAGQPAYNGVAIASRRSISDVTIGLYDDSPEADRRLLACTVEGVRIMNVYVPNGRDTTLPSFREKLRFLERLRITLDTGSSPELPLVLCGDFNVARDERDVHDPARFRGRLHFHPEERAALERVIAFGFEDAYRRFHAEGGRYTWWDYRGGDFRMNRGLRIDYVFVTGAVGARMRRAEIDPDPRREPGPSDHAPVFIELDT
jgi:exodeoxyribonuclease-3